MVRIYTYRVLIGTGYMGPRGMFWCSVYMCMVFMGTACLSVQDIYKQAMAWKKSRHTMVVCMHTQASMGRRCIDMV